MSEIKEVLGSRMKGKLSEYNIRWDDNSKSWWSEADLVALGYELKVLNQYKAAQGKGASKAGTASPTPSQGNKAGGGKKLSKKQQQQKEQLLREQEEEKRLRDQRAQEKEERQERERQERAEEELQLQISQQQQQMLQASLNPVTSDDGDEGFYVQKKKGGVEKLGRRVENGDAVFVDAVLEFVMRIVAGRFDGHVQVLHMATVNHRWLDISSRPSIWFIASKRLLAPLGKKFREWVRQGDSLEEAKQVFKAYKLREQKPTSALDVYWFPIWKDLYVIGRSRAWTVFSNNLTKFLKTVSSRGFTRDAVEKVAVKSIGQIAGKCWFYNDWTAALELGKSMSASEITAQTPEIVDALKQKITFFARFMNFFIHPTWKKPHSDFRQIINLVGKYSQYNDTWFLDAANALTWYIAFIYGNNQEEETLKTQVTAACTNHFSDWTSPTPAATETVVDLALVIAIRTKLRAYLAGLDALQGYFVDYKTTPVPNTVNEILINHIFISLDMRWASPPAALAALLKELDEKKKAEEGVANKDQDSGHVKYMKEHYLPSLENAEVVEKKFFGTLEKVLKAARESDEHPSFTFDALEAAQREMIPAVTEKRAICILEGSVTPAQGEPMPWMISFPLSADEKLECTKDLGQPEREYTGTCTSSNIDITVTWSSGPSKGNENKYVITHDGKKFQGTADKKGSVTAPAVIKGTVSIHTVEAGEVGSWRTETAYAHGGRHKYAHFEGIEEVFSTKLAHDMKDDAHPVLRAVRLFFDIIYFHPFTDGNGRASHLWFHYCLAHGGYNFPADWTSINALPKLPMKEHYWQFATAVVQDLLQQYS